MTPNQQREELSKAYVAAVAARAGCKLASWSQDSGCLDVTVGTHSGFEGTLAAPKLDLQLRSSSKPKTETPKSQLFSPDALLSLLERVSRNDGRDRALEGQS